MLNSSIPGRSDKLPISVAPGSYVLPSDTVLALGDGNTMSGDQIIRHVLHHARLGAGLPMGSGPNESECDRRELCRWPQMVVP